MLVTRKMNDEYAAIRAIMNNVNHPAWDKAESAITNGHDTARECGLQFGSDDYEYKMIEVTVCTFNNEA